MCEVKNSNLTEEEESVVETEGAADAEAAQTIRKVRKITEPTKELLQQTRQAFKGYDIADDIPASLVCRVSFYNFVNVEPSDG